MQGNPITATCTAKATHSADYEAKGNLCIVYLNYSYNRPWHGYLIHWKTKGGSEVFKYHSSHLNLFFALTCKTR